MYFDLTLSMVQTALIVLKILAVISCSWWLVMLPSIAWVVFGVIVTATDKDE